MEILYLAQNVDDKVQVEASKVFGIDSSVNLKFTNYSDIISKTLQDGSILIIDISGIKKDLISSIINLCKESFISNYFIRYSSKEELSFVKEIIDDKKAVGVFGSFDDDEITSKVFKSFCNICFELKELRRSIDYLTEVTENELKRVKRIHKSIIKDENTKLDGVNLHVRYSPGVNEGSAFFDHIIIDHNVLCFLFSTNSYLKSSMIIEEFYRLKERLKTINNFDDKKFIETISNKLRALGQDGILDVDFMFINLNTKTMSCKVINLGNSFIKSNRKIHEVGNDYPLDINFIDKSVKNFELSRGESLVGLSKGVKQSSTDNKVLFATLDKFLGIKNQDLLEELFYSLKRKDNNSLVKYDAVAFIIEVSNNVIYKI